MYVEHALYTRARAYTLKYFKWQELIVKTHTGAPRVYFGNEVL
jgi:hypothetical protein